MPRLIRSPEEIFRAEKKDLYVIHSKEELHGEHPGLQEVSDWIALHLPGTAVEQLGPSEYSGVISGDFVKRLRVNFTEEGLSAFCERWERNNASIDARFQCFIYPYDRWLQKRGSTVATPETPNGKGPVIWIHTPSGFFGNQCTETDAHGRYHSRHPSNQRDLWVNIVQSLPKLAASDSEQLTYGNLFCTPDGRPKVATYVRPWHQMLKQASTESHDPFHPTVEQIRNWLRLPADVDVLEDDF